MNTAAAPLGPFIVRLLVLIPLMLLLWWFVVLGPLLDVLVVAADWAAGWFLPATIIGFEAMAVNAVDSMGKQHLPSWILLTSLSYQDQPFGTVSIAFNAARFTFGLPLFWALVLSGPAGKRIRDLLIGTLVIIPLLVVMYLLFAHSAVVAQIDPRLYTPRNPPFVLAAPGPFYLSYLAYLGGKLSQLILPPVVPVLVWLWRNPNALRFFAQSVPESAMDNEVVEPEALLTRHRMLAWGGVTLVVVVLGVFSYDSQRLEFKRGMRAYGSSQFTSAVGFFNAGNAKRPHPPSEYRLGEMFTMGLGVNRDTDRGLFWLYRAAKAGYGPAQYALSKMAMMGDGMDASPNLSFDWSRILAEQGYAPAQFRVATMLEQGIGIEPDPSQAEHWYRRAADNGFKPAVSVVNRLQR